MKSENSLILKSEITELEDVLVGCEMWTKETFKNICKVVHMNLAYSTLSCDVTSTAAEQREWGE
jgi:hypothetical protein